MGLGLDPVRRTAPAHTLQAGLDRHVQQQGQARHDADHAPFQFGDEVAVTAARRALVGVAGIGETIADHPATGRKRGQDGSAHVLGPAGKHQQQLGFRRGRLMAGREQQVADLLGQRRAAGLAGTDDRFPGRLQRLAQLRQHGRFTRAFAAFQGDQAGLHLQAHLDSPARSIPLTRCR